MNAKIALPHLLPNEHLLGALARWFNQSGHKEFRRTCLPYFQNLSTITPMAVWRPLYSEIARHYEQSMSFDILLQEHTLLNYYRPFLPAAEHRLFADDTLLSMSNIKVQPGLQKHLKAAHHWRWCADCVAEDTKSYGGAYWHTYHQIPTMLRCYRHGFPLLSTCTSCGFRFTSFNTSWLPPEETSCPSCKEEYQSLGLNLPATAHWLEAVSAALQAKSTNLTLDEITQRMRERLGYPSLPTRPSVSMRKTMTNMRISFSNSLDDNLLSLYFQDKPAVLKANQKLLNLVWMAYRSASVPPVSILLMLEYLGAEHELTRRLIREEGA